MAEWTAFGSCKDQFDWPAAEEGEAAEGDALYTCLIYGTEDGSPSEEYDMGQVVWLINEGHIDDETLVYTDGFDEWTRFADCKDKFDWPAVQEE